MRKQRYTVKSSLRSRLSINKYNLKWAKLSAPPEGALEEFLGGPARQSRFAPPGGPRGGGRAPEGTRAIARPGKEDLAILRSDRPTRAPAGGPRNAEGPRRAAERTRIAKLLATNHMRIRTTRVQSEWNRQFLAKQALKYFYGGLSEKTLINTAKLAKSLGVPVTSLFEQRLDVIVYRLKMARSIFEARQLITHGHIIVTLRHFSGPDGRSAEQFSRSAPLSPLAKRGALGGRFAGGYIVPVGSLITCNAEMCYSSALSRTGPTQRGPLAGAATCPKGAGVQSRGGHSGALGGPASRGAGQDSARATPGHLVKLSTRKGILVRTPNANETLAPRDFNANTAALVALRAS